jgi:hypothetical protein
MQNKKMEKQNPEWVTKIISLEKNKEDEELKEADSPIKAETASDSKAETDSPL